MTVDIIYRNVDKIYLTTYLSLLRREIRLGLVELRSRSENSNPSHGHIRNYGSAIIIIITRWIIASFQLAALLMMGGFERYSCFVKTDSMLILFYLYGTYQTITESINIYGYSPQSYNIMWQQVPWITIGILAFTILSVVRGLATEQSQSNVYTVTSPTPDMDYASASPLASSAYANASNTGNPAARTSDVIPYRIALHEFGSSCVRPGHPGNDGIWCLHPERSLRGTWLEAKRISGASWYGETINGLPLACIRTVLWSSIILSGYLYARTFSCEEQDGGSESFPLYQLYNYIHGLTGLERRPSQIPSDSESISLYHYGTMHNESEEELQSVTVL